MKGLNLPDAPAGAAVDEVDSAKEKAAVAEDEAAEMEADAAAVAEVVPREKAEAAEEAATRAVAAERAGTMADKVEEATEKATKEEVRKTGENPAMATSNGGSRSQMEMGKAAPARAAIGIPRPKAPSPKTTFQRHIQPADTG